MIGDAVGMAMKARSCTLQIPLMRERNYWPALNAGIKPSEPAATSLDAGNRIPAALLHLPDIEEPAEDIYQMKKKPEEPIPNPPEIDISESQRMKLDPVRARFLMSPYNIREAHRQAEFRRLIWYTVAIASVAAGVAVWFAWIK